MTPLELRLMVEIAIGPLPPGHPTKHCRTGDPWAQALDMFFDQKLIEREEDGETLRPTERGRAFVDFLCSMPLPVANWTIPGPIVFSALKELSL